MTRSKFSNNKKQLVMVYTCDLIFMGQPLARTVAHSVQWPGWVVLMTFFKIRDTETYYLFYMEYSKSDQ